jgi:acetyltransferase
MDSLKVWKADDETVLTLRRLNESDTQRLIAFVKGLSVTARYFRFGQGDYEPGLDDALRVCRLDPEQGVHLIVVTSGDAVETVVGSARYVIQPDRSSCEFVVVVADKWNHHGIGHQLMDALLSCAKSQGLQKMYGRVLGSNLDMLQFVKACGFEISDSPEGPWLKIARIDLQPLA